LGSLNLLDKNLIIFYQGGYFSSEKPILLIRNTILKLCSEMKDEAIGLIDSIAPPDYVLNSILGNSNGDVYNTLYNSMVQSPNTFNRLSWYEDFMVKKPFGHLRAKI
jgi:acyl-CoA oxidase